MWSGSEPALHRLTVKGPIIHDFPDERKLTTPTSNVCDCAVVCGITTSILLETLLLRLGKDRMTWHRSAQTAFGMSMISMLAMETTENMETLGLLDPGTSIESAEFWGVTAISVVAGFLVPLPYNYLRLRVWGKACH